MKNILYLLLLSLFLTMSLAFQAPPPPDGGGDPALVKDVPDVSLELNILLILTAIIIASIFYSKKQYFTRSLKLVIYNERN